MMSAEQHRQVAALEPVVCRVAARYARRCFRVDVEDLRQEARAAIVEMVDRGTFDPTIGVPLSAYAWRVAVLRLKHYLWKTKAPVTGPAGSDDYGTTLRGLRGVDVAALEHTVDTTELPDEQSEREAWEIRAAVQLLDALGESGDDAVIAWRILYHGEKARDVAADLGVPVRHVYRVTHRATRAMRENYALYKLWKEL